MNVAAQPIDAVDALDDAIRVRVGQAVEVLSYLDAAAALALSGQGSLPLDRVGANRGEEVIVDLNSIMIGSEKPERLKEYYTKLFGKPSYEDPGDGYGYSSWQLGTGYLSVGPHDQVKGKNQSPGRILWNIETPDVKSEFERLKEAGATVVQEPYNPSGDMQEVYVCTFADPDDNYFQLMSPMPME